MKHRAGTHKVLYDGRKRASEATSGSPVSGAGPTPSVSNVSTIAGAIITTLAVNYPTSVGTGNLILLALGAMSSTSTPTLSDPAGWTKVNDATLTSGSNRYHVALYAKASAGESGTLSCTCSGLTSGEFAGNMMLVTGVDASLYEAAAEIDASDSFDPCLSVFVGHNTPTFTTLGSNRLAIVAEIVNQVSTTATPSGFTGNSWSVQDSQGVGAGTNKIFIVWSIKTISSATTDTGTGNDTATGNSTGSTNGFAFSVCAKPNPPS